jgi:hypothetical protein
MSISRHAVSGPLPPNAHRSKSRTSRPRLTVTWRIALAWFQAAISSTPAAQASTSIPTASASRPYTASAASRCSGISPPSRCSGMWPSSMNASVVVGSDPPPG